MRNPLKDRGGFIGKRERERERGNCHWNQVNWFMLKRWKIDEDKNNFNRYNKKGHGNK